MKIKSLSDVITNSSHEVFIFRDIKDPGELKRYIKSKTDVMSEPWLFKEEDTFNKIYIPKGSITEDYSVDLE